MLLNKWKELNLDDREDFLDELRNTKASQLNFSIERESLHTNYPRIRLECEGFDLFFRLIFSHEIGFGLSKECKLRAEKISSPLQANIEEMEPYLKKRVAMIAVSELPFSEIHANRIGNYFKSPRSQPAYLSKHQVDQCLNALNARLPSELEWEAMVRCGRDRLFPFGNNLIDEEDLSAWMEYDYDSKMAELENGVKGIFFGEWCSDVFKLSHAENASAISGSNVIKGGAAYFWPWQDQEWVWCMCAMRMPSTDLDEGVAVGRPVFGL